MGCRFPMQPLLLLLLLAPGDNVARLNSRFTGTWVLRMDGQNILILSLAGLMGALTKPKELILNQDGEVTAIGPGQVTLPIQKAIHKRNQLELTIDGDRFLMAITGSNRASLRLQGMRPWILQRVTKGKPVLLASSLNGPDYSTEIRTLRDRLRAMVQEDQSARLAFDQARIEAADVEHRSEVLRIFETYGWVTNSLAGKSSAHDFWLLVQHQIPEIQRELLPALRKAAKAGEASLSDYAYLHDRVQVGLGRPQHWGSQTRCRNGKPVLEPVDDLPGLNARRKKLHLGTVGEYLKSDYLVNFCSQAAPEADATAPKPQ